MATISPVKTVNQPTKVVFCSPPLYEYDSKPKKDKTNPRIVETTKKVIIETSKVNLGFKLVILFFLH